MKTLFKHVNLIDVEQNCAVFEDTSVLVENDKIVSIGEEAKADRVIDVKGAYMLPGLINLHVHLFGSGAPSKALGGGPTQKFLMKFLKTKLGALTMDNIIKKTVDIQLRSGVTTLRAMGDFCYSDVRIRDKIKSGQMVGPRMLVSGPAITVPTGHGDGTFAVTSDDIPTLCSYVDKNIDAGVDWIKICVTGGVMDAKEVGHPGELKMSLEQTKAVCDHAHERGFKVASHTESPEGLEVALKGGVDTIEHGAFVNDECAELYKAHGAAQVITLSPCVPLSTLDPSITKLDDKATYNTKIVGQGMIDGAKRAMQDGIALGLGTDASCPLCMQYNTWRELEYLHQVCGMPIADTLRTATLENARIVDLGDVTGSIAVGKAADLLIVKENPLEDLKALRDPLYVMANGALLEQPQQKKNEQIESWLDSINLKEGFFKKEA